MPVAARFGREYPDDTVIGQRRPRVDQGVHQITVFVAPPQQHYIDDFIGVFVEQLGTKHLLDGRAHVVIDVGVPAELLHAHVGWDPEPLGNAELAGVSRRGGDHGFTPPQHQAGVDRRTCYYSMTYQRTLRSTQSATASTRTRRCWLVRRRYLRVAVTPSARRTSMEHDGHRWPVQRDRQPVTCGFPGRLEARRSVDHAARPLTRPGAGHPRRGGGTSSRYRPR